MTDKNHNFVKVTKIYNKQQLDLLFLLTTDSICLKCKLYVNYHKNILLLDEETQEYYDGLNACDNYLSCEEIIIKNLLE